MSEQAPHAPLTNAVCMHCGYTLDGITPNEDGLVTCPECGTELIRSTRPILTRRGVLKRLAYTLVLPSVIWGVLTVFLTVLLQATPAAVLVLALFVLGSPLAQLIGVLFVWSQLHQALKPHPRPFSRWTLPLLACAFCLPSAGILIGVVRLLAPLM